MKSSVDIGGMVLGTHGAKLCWTGLFSGNGIPGTVTEILITAC